MPDSTLSQLCTNVVVWRIFKAKSCANLAFAELCFLSDAISAKERPRPLKPRGGGLELHNDLWAVLALRDWAARFPHTITKAKHQGCFIVIIVCPHHESCKVKSYKYYGQKERLTSGASPSPRFPQIENGKKKMCVAMREQEFLLLSQLPQDITTCKGPFMRPAVSPLLPCRSTSSRVG